MLLARSIIYLLVLPIIAKKLCSATEEIFELISSHSKKTKFATEETNININAIMTKSYRFLNCGHNDSMRSVFTTSESWWWFQMQKCTLAVLIKRSSSHSPSPCSHWHHLHVEPPSPTDWFVPSPLADNHASDLQFPSLRRDGLNAWRKKTRRSDFWDFSYCRFSNKKLSLCPNSTLNVHSM